MNSLNTLKNTSHYFLEMQKLERDYIVNLYFGNSWTSGLNFSSKIIKK